MPLTQRDHVVRTLPQDAPDDTLGAAVLPGTLASGDDLVNTHGSQLALSAPQIASRSRMRNRAVAFSNRHTDREMGVQLSLDRGGRRVQRSIFSNELDDVLHLLPVANGHLDRADGEIARDAGDGESIGARLFEQERPVLVGEKAVHGGGLIGENGNLPDATAVLERQGLTVAFESKGDVTDSLHSEDDLARPPRVPRGSAGRPG